MTTDIAYPELHDVSLVEARRIVGCGYPVLRAAWPTIPTAYRTPGGQYRVTIWGLKQWLIARSGVSNKA